MRFPSLPQIAGSVLKRTERSPAEDGGVLKKAARLENAFLNQNRLNHP